MSISYKRKCFGHNSIYEDDYLIDNYKKRQFNLYYSSPEKGVNEHTGILLLIAGYGGHSNSNIFIKMRNQFADKYNLVTIQCDYFGYEFMQSNLEGPLQIKNLDLNEIKNNASPEDFNKICINNTFNLQNYLNSHLKHETVITVESFLNENISNFNDMGIMQALDNIVATKEVINELTSNNLKFNTNKVIIMGNSHGSYLAYLCNSMCRGLYTHILDNSSWLYPTYYNNERTVSFHENNSIVNSIYNYNMINIIPGIEPFNLKDLYRTFDNTCKIVVYHGEDDDLIPEAEKYEAVKDINNLIYKPIRKPDLDGLCFKSTSHGLNADYINLFDKYYTEYINDNICNNKVNIEEEIELYPDIFINYKSGFPEFILNFEG
ncbi:MAG: DUF2920 family protein [Clostridium sp.]